MTGVLKSKLYGLRDKRTGEYAVLDTQAPTETMPLVYEIYGAHLQVAQDLWLTGYRQEAEAAARQPADPDWTNMYEPWYKDGYDWEVIEFDLTEKSPEYHTYRVSWEIELSALNPRQAAEMAREIQLDPQSTATVFSAYDIDGTSKLPYTVDTLDYGAEQEMVD